MKMKEERREVLRRIRAILSEIENVYFQRIGNKQPDTVILANQSELQKAAGNGTENRTSPSRPMAEPFCCDFCKAKFETYHKLIEHYDEAHNGMRLGPE